MGGDPSAAVAAERLPVVERAIVSRESGLVKTLHPQMHETDNTWWTTVAEQ